MNNQTFQKGNKITRQIIMVIFAIAAVCFVVEGISEYFIGKNVEAAKTLSLPELLTRKNTSGEVVKLNEYTIDVKRRINALPEPGVKEDIHIMVPLRPIGQDDEADVVALFALMDYDYNCVQDALDVWKDSLINLRSGEEMCVEVIGLDELPGNVPNVVKKNERVAKKVLVFREVKYTGAEGVLLFMAGAMGLVAFLIYRRVKAENARDQFTEV